MSNIPPNGGVFLLCNDKNFDMIYGISKRLGKKTVLQILMYFYFHYRSFYHKIKYKGISILALRKFSFIKSPSFSLNFT
jgi:hypothetical protein